MKRLILLVAGIVLVAGMVPLQADPVNKGLDERMFGAFIHFRAELNLTEEQNVLADELLNEMKEAAIAIRLREIQHIENALASFISDDFDPRLMLPLPLEVQAEIREHYNLFMAQKVLALHDLLTAEQRQLLVDLIIENRETAQ